MRPLPLLLLTALLACGCALTAKKTPTPAAQLSPEELAALPAQPDERYFLVLFGSQKFSRNPNYTHTWASLVRVRTADVGGCGTATPGEIDPALDVQTISWLPLSGDVQVKNLTVRPGRNFGLHETLKLVYDEGESVAMWGPYEVWHGFAYRFTVQKAFLDSGAVGYQANDVRGEAGEYGNGCDCIHAIADMDPIYPRWRYPLALYGKAATANLVRRLMHSPIWLEPKKTHDWLLPRLGLDAYPINQRHYVGFAEELKNDGNGLNAVSRPLPAAPPRPKEPTPKTAPGTGTGKLPVEPPKTPTDPPKQP